MAERRRLPVLQSSKPPPSPDAKSDGGGAGDGGDDAIEKRPPWHWVGFGAVGIFATWLPAAFLAQKTGELLVRRRFGDVTEEELTRHLASLPKDDVMMVFLPLALLHLGALFVGAISGGYLVGRFGSGTTVREPMLAGGVVALMAMVLTLGRGGVASSLVTGSVVFLAAVGGAALGGKYGLKKKDKAAPVADG
ncbi:MAG: hypothetical protein JST00_10125 [Deltaproteobacteria bacterium]|nr:hypothetical protein [Deltaproteobacteria bacterium]